MFRQRPNAAFQRGPGAISHAEGAVSAMLQHRCCRWRVQFACGKVGMHGSSLRLTRPSWEERTCAQTEPTAVLMKICQSERGIGTADSVHGAPQHQQEPQSSVHAVPKRRNAICSRLGCGFCSLSRNVVEKGAHLRPA